MNSMAKIKNIIFDLGGVLINIDYKRTEKAFADLGVKNFDEMYAQVKADALFESLETGHITEDHFYEKMTSRGFSLQRSQVEQAWNAMLLDFRVESFHFLDQLRDRYDLYLLSNTNVIHKAAFEKIFTEQTGLPSIDNYFKKAWYSHLMGLRKPNEDIFHFVLKDAGLKPYETLFIDDTLPNIEGAKHAGIRTHLLLPGERIEDLQYDLI